MDPLDVQGSQPIKWRVACDSTFRRHASLSFPHSPPLYREGWHEEDQVGAGRVLFALPPAAEKALAQQEPRSVRRTAPVIEATSKLLSKVASCHENSSRKNRPICSLQNVDVLSLAPTAEIQTYTRLTIWGRTTLRSIPSHSRLIRLKP